MMGRLPGSHEEENNNNNRVSVKKGPWTAEEDRLLMDHIKKHGHGSWRALPKLAGLNRCGKSCRLRWTNYLRPDIKRGKFTDQEEQVIISMHAALGNKWSAIAGNLPGRTDNEIKNFWNTHLRKKLLKMGLDPITHRPKTEHLDLISYLNQLLTAANIITGFTTTTLLSNHQSPNKLQMLQSMLLQFLASSSSSNANINPLPTNIESSNNPLGLLEPIIPPLSSELYDDLGLNSNNNNNNNNNNVSPLASQNHQMAGEFSPNDQKVLFEAITNNNNNCDPTASSSSASFGSNSLPNLVSASSPPECSNNANNNNNNNKQMERNDSDNIVVMMNPNEFSNSSATFATWASDFIYGEPNDAYWNALIHGRESNEA